ncbi:MAG: hypothetical protein U1E21_14345 [Reyranellaceae bacterium]
MVGPKTGWNCMFAAIEPLAAGVWPVHPGVGLALRGWMSRRKALRSWSAAE